MEARLASIFKTKKGGKAIDKVCHLSPLMLIYDKINTHILGSFHFRVVLKCLTLPFF